MPWVLYEALLDNTAFFYAAVSIASAMTIDSNGT